MDNNDSGGSTKTACHQGGDMETDSNAIDTGSPKIIDVN